MLIRLYSVYDRVAQVYSEPFSAVNDATALRSFTIAQSSPESMLYSSPADFQLWYIGSLDNNSGELLSYDDLATEPHKVCDGKPREVTEHE
jgi:hypothetical protein|nr:MAG TPA: DNA binding protein [Microviridae sp.]